MQGSVTHARILGWWPAATLALAFALGAAWQSIGGGVLAATLALLAVGPASLVFTRRRRRRDAAGAARVHRDANETVAALARSYRRLVRRSRVVQAVSALLAGELLLAVSDLAGWWAALTALVAVTLSASNFAAARRRLDG